MFCAQNNRLHCGDCNKFYNPDNYSNHLKSKGIINAVMKKRCSTCNIDITHSNNHDFNCCMIKLCLEPKLV